MGRIKDKFRRTSAANQHEPSRRQVLKGALALAGVALPPDSYHAFVELHIEQGPLWSAHAFHSAW